MPRSLTLPALFAMVSVLAACSPSEPPDEPIRAVKLVKVEGQTISGEQEYAADIRARTESRLGFRVGGKLVQRPAEVGMTVKAGQLLAMLDAQDLRSGAEAAVAQVKAAQTQRDLAAADFRRFEALRQQGFISGAELERREASLKAAQASLELAQAQASVQNNQAAYARLLADADGVVVGVDAEPGQVVAAGAPVVRVARNGPRDAVMTVPEDRVLGIRQGQSAEVVLWTQQANGSPLKWPARVREVAASADPVTRTYAVKVTIEGDVQPPLGATATVRIRPAQAAGAQGVGTAVVRLPTSALWRQTGQVGQGSAVWVFDTAEGVVRARPVQVEGVDGNLALIAQGLQPGDEVVVAGTHVLNEGQRVVRYGPEAAR
jgi:membrane fusion protein, multidrug efflux system